jgi:hypothetical protein
MSKSVPLLNVILPTEIILTIFLALELFVLFSNYIFDFICDTSLTPFGITVTLLFGTDALSMTLFLVVFDTVII